MSVKNKRILLIISGGVAAYKMHELVRLIKKNDAEVRCVLTPSAAEFVSPMLLAVLSGNKVGVEIFSANEDFDINHISNTEWADLLVVAPATANTIAKMVHGVSDNLALSTYLAHSKHVMVAPAMNVNMWNHAATQHNMIILEERGTEIIGPDEGELACGTFGKGRMSSEVDIFDRICEFFAGESNSDKPLLGKKAIVTSGPTYEAIDPVRFIGNRSSGKQGHAIAVELMKKGAEVVLVTGPTGLNDPDGMNVVHIQSAKQMLKACENAFPADILVCAAAVSDWGVNDPAHHKIKKDDDLTPPTITLTPNPDILAMLAKNGNRPEIVVGFAAETDNVIENAKVKLVKKGCDFIVANDVAEGTSTFGGDNNTVHIVTHVDVQSLSEMTKVDVAKDLVKRIINRF
ncbi:MAG: bifunctional phosphopantothenoylcysteine decarboxylase/phosphopantothenate--cysteine ligase CoaBC [Alphaproteobacteria bacterium]|nr:bifunctional phosphopantothenoylcysteine decarboxylase/phosphopantothenate--cysteine ligase CoaBC [Alphaproteobacteria bacterium]